MNIRHEMPEMIGTLRMVNSDGDEACLGDKIIGIQVSQDTISSPGLVQFDVRDFKRNTNLLLEIELQELVAALARATLNAERNE